MTLDDVAIVLCRPEEPGNVGAVCRAMKNMGIERLILAGAPWLAAARGLADTGAPDAVIRARAVHAVDVWERAVFTDTLAEAVAGRGLVIGTTRRRGRRRKSTVTPAEAAALLRERPGTAALVFGNERTGLVEPEIELCNLTSHIPASGAFPSLNLSHAVMIYAYELFSALGPAGQTARGSLVPLTQDDLAALSREVCDGLESLGFYRQPGRAAQERFLRDVCARAALTAGEARYLAGIVTKAAALRADAERGGPAALRAVAESGGPQARSDVEGVVSRGPPDSAHWF